MGTEHYEVENPILVDTFKTDSAGRINLGSDYGDKNIKVCVIRIEDES